MTGWRVEYEDGVPVQMRWVGQQSRASRRCPRTWPHEPHGPWWDGQARRLDDPDARGFDCPGVELGETGE